MKEEALPDLEEKCEALSGVGNSAKTHHECGTEESVNGRRRLSGMK